MAEYFDRCGSSINPTTKYEFYPGKLVVKFKNPKGFLGILGLKPWEVTNELMFTSDTKILEADILGEGHANIKVTAGSSWTGIEEGVANIYIYKNGREFLSELKRCIS